MAASPSSNPSPAPGPRPLPQLLRRAWYGLNQAFRRRISHLDLTPDQYTVLRNLADAGTPGLTQSELTVRMTSDPNTIASLVERMEAAGMLRRETDPRDRRARRLRLAPAGRIRYRAARRIALALQAEVLGSLPVPEREPFLATLAQVSEACRRASEAGGNPADPPPPAPRRKRAEPPPPPQP